MPTSATGIWTTESGFTLLEVLVVLVLIGIITTFAVMRLPGDPATNRLAATARGLQQFIERQRDEAVLGGTSRGLRFATDGCTALSLDAGDWQPLTAPRDHYALPASLTLALSVDDQPLAPSPTGPPQIVLAASGETSAFQLTIQAGDDGYRLRGDVVGHVDLVELP